MFCSCLFFFFKQKTAYEMRISDWSSDVCSSDLRLEGAGGRLGQGPALLRGALVEGDHGQGAEGGGRAQDRAHVVRIGHLIEQHDNPARRGWLGQGRAGGENLLQGRLVERGGAQGEALVDAAFRQQGVEIGRASGRERVCQYV